jgi:hypothetical protein
LPSTATFSHVTTLRHGFRRLHQRTRHPQTRIVAERLENKTQILVLLVAISASPAANDFLLNGRRVDHHRRTGK